MTFDSGTTEDKNSKQISITWTSLDLSTPDLAWPNTVCLHRVTFRIDKVSYLTTVVCNIESIERERKY